MRIKELRELLNKPDVDEFCHIFVFSMTLDGRLVPAEDRSYAIVVAAEIDGDGDLILAAGGER